MSEGQDPVARDIVATDDPAVCGERLARAISRVEPAILLTGERHRTAAKVVEAVAAVFAGRQIDLLRLDPVPRSPAEMEEIVAALADPQPGERRTVLVIDHAEHVPADVLAILAEAMPGLDRVQLLLVGGPGVRTLLETPPLASLRDSIGTVITLAAPKTPPPVNHEPPAAALQPAPITPVRISISSRKSALVSLGVAGLLLAVALALVAYPGYSHRQPAPSAKSVAASEQPVGPDPPAALAVPAAPAPAIAAAEQPPASPALPVPAAKAKAVAAFAQASGEPDPPAATTVAPAGPANAIAASTTAPVPSPESAPAATSQPAAAPPAPAARDGAELQSDFEQFLDQHGQSTAKLSPAERARLFDNFKAWRDGSEPATASAPLDGRRIVVHYEASSRSGEAEASRIASALSQQSRPTEIRAVRTTPRRPTVRFFFGSDRDAATDLSRSLDPHLGRWRVQDFASAHDRPEPGTLEVWLPSR